MVNAKGQICNQAQQTMTGRTEDPIYKSYDCNTPLTALTIMASKNIHECELWLIGLKMTKA